MRLGISRLASTLLLTVTIASCKTGGDAGSALDSAPLRPDHCGNPLAPDRANPNHCEGPFYLDGKYNLRPEVLKEIYRFYVEDDDDVRKYEGPAVAANHFGSFLLKVPGVTPLFTADGVSVFKPVISDSTGKPKYFREHHYHLGQGRIGMRLLPIVDREGKPYDEDGIVWKAKGNESNPYFDYDPSKSNLARDMGNGTRIYGSEEVDRYLRKVYGAAESDESFPIFALTSYIHPEQHEGSIFELLKQKFFKTEAGITHLGGYIGKGMTRNAPLNYRSQKWGISGYPVTLATVTMDGVSSQVLNRNILTTLEVLNRFGAGVEFPDDYKFDRFRAIDLKETFDFYRGWVDHDWVRPEDEDSIFWTLEDLERYSDEERNGVAELVGVPTSGLEKAAMIAQIYEKQKRIPFYQKLTQLESYRTYCAEHLTIALNIAVNLPQNEAGYIETWGAEAGAKLWSIVKEKYRAELGQELKPNAAFTPLWKKEGLPSPSKSEVFGAGMAWPIKTTADIMAGFLENYLNWTDRNLSPYYTVAAIVGMMPVALNRLKIKPEEYLDAVVVPIYLTFKHGFTVKLNRAIERLPEAGGLKKQALRAHMSTVTRGLLWSEMTALEKQTQMKVKERIVDPVMKLLTADASLDFILAHASSTPSQAWDNYRSEMRETLQKLRDQPGGTALDESSEDTKYVLHYSPPAVIHHIASNMYPVNRHVKIQEVATAMEAGELCATNRAFTVYDMNKTLPEGYTCEALPP